MAPPSASRRGPFTRSGSTSGVNIVGLRELKKELRRLENPRQWLNEFRKLNRAIAKDARDKSRSYAVANGGATKHFAKAIVGKGSADAARLQIADENAYGVFWGAKNRWTGWNAYHSVTNAPNFPEWVGNTWEVGVRGQGPYILNDVVADNKERYAEWYGDAVDEILSRAFPD